MILLKHDTLEPQNLVPITIKRLSIDLHKNDTIFVFLAKFVLNVNLL